MMHHTSDHGPFRVRRRVTTLLACTLVAQMGMVTGAATITAAAGATFAVTSTADPGNGVCDTDCTLREAITAANASPGLDTISFAIAGAGVQAITLSSDLPIVSSPAVLDATTQPGYTGTPLIDLRDGGPASRGLRVDAAGSTVRGFAINNFADGIVLVGGGNSLIELNHIGVDPAGEAVVGNTQTGVLVSGSSNNRIRSNVLGGNASGVGFQVGADSNTVTGNFIGTDRTGTLNLGNRSDNVFVFTNNNTIGGPNPGDGNVIANSVTRTGITVQGQGNRISGNSIRNNALVGIELTSGGNGLQPAPTAIDAGTWGTGAHLTGSVSGGAGPWRIEFFSNAQCDSGGRGEGATYLGTTTVTTAGAFAVDLPMSLTAGSIVTATSTNEATGNTSAFSVCATAHTAPAPAASLTVTPSQLLPDVGPVPVDVRLSWGSPGHAVQVQQCGVRPGSGRCIGLLDTTLDASGSLHAAINLRYDLYGATFGCDTGPTSATSCFVTVADTTVGGYVANTAPVTFAGHVDLGIPRPAAQSVTTAEDTAAAITLGATDPNGDPITYAVASQPANGTLTGIAPNVMYTPAPNWNGTDTFTFTAADASGTSAPATVTVVVAPVDDAPTADPVAVQAVMGTPAAVSLAGADVDGDPLTYSIVDGPTHGAVSGAGQNVTYTPAAGFGGSDTFTYSVTANGVTSATATVTVNVVGASIAVTPTSGLSRTTTVTLNLSISGGAPGRRVQVHTCATADSTFCRVPLTALLDSNGALSALIDVRYDMFAGDLNCDTSTTPVRTCVIEVVDVVTGLPIGPSVPIQFEQPAPPATVVVTIAGADGLYHLGLCPESTFVSFYVGCSNGPLTASATATVSSGTGVPTVFTVTPGTYDTGLAHWYLNFPFSGLVHAPVTTLTAAAGSTVYCTADMSVGLVCGDQPTGIITTPPNASTLQAGQSLAAATLDGGRATVAGVFTFTDPTVTPAPGTSDQSVTFTPSDSVLPAVTLMIPVTVTSAVVIVSPPIASAIDYGQPLGDVVLSGGEASVPGSFAFADPTIVPEPGTGTFDVVFTPSGPTYDAVTFGVPVTVRLLIPTVATPLVASSITYGQTLAQSSIVDGSMTVPGSFGFADPTIRPTPGVSQQSVVFTPTDPHYTSVAVPVSVTTVPLIAVVSVAPDAGPITYGQTLASSQLGLTYTTNVPGRFSFTFPDLVPPPGVSDQSVTFTPDDPHIAPVTTTVKVSAEPPLGQAIIVLDVQDSPGSYTTSFCGLNTYVRVNSALCDDQSAQLNHSHIATSTATSTIITLSPGDYVTETWRPTASPAGYVRSLDRRVVIGMGEVLHCHVSLSTGTVCDDPWYPAEPVGLFVDVHQPSVLTPTVSWIAPDGGSSPPFSYPIELLLAGTSTWTPLGQSETTSTVLPTLTPGAQYSVRVAGGNILGQGAWSRPLTFVVPNVPATPAAPTLTTTGTAVTASWVAPDGRGTAVTSYLLEYRPAGTAGWTSVSVDAPTTTTTIAGLTPGTTYDFRVTAVNLAGSSTPSPIAQIRVTVDYSVTLTFTGNGSGSVSLVPNGNPSAGIVCPFTTCTFTSAEETVVTLTPTPAPGSVFAGWNGAGCGTATTCTFTLGADTPVSASFVRLPTITSFTPTAGSVGTSVTITGTNFCTPRAGTPPCTPGTAAIDVSFNGVRAAFTVVSSTTIVTSVPVGATTGLLQVVTPFGSVKSATVFTVRGAPVAPTVTAYSASFVRLGVATQMTVTGTNLGGATAVSINGVAVAYTVLSPTSIGITVPASGTTAANGATWGPVRVTTAGGTSTNTNTLWINAAPTQVSAGFRGTCSRLADGTARCWGLNNNGRLATGDSTRRQTPSPVMVDATTPLTGVAGISLGNSHACAVLSAGSIRCWGLNTNGQLGNGTATNTLFANQVVSGITNATQVSAGRDYTCARLADGTARCWGSNTNGRVGNGSRTQANVTRPATVLTSAGVPLTGVVTVSTGDLHACALLTNGTVRCWGTNTNGQLGIGTTANNAFASQAVTGITTATQLAAGANYSCAVLSDGTARCWGLNTNGRLGDGTTVQRTTPVTVLTAAGVPLTGVSAISTGSNPSAAAVPVHTCALSFVGTLRCWGDNSTGGLGNGTVTSTLFANQVVSGVSGVMQVSAGTDHTAAVLASTTVVSTVNAWGGNGQGQLGDGTLTQRLTQVQTPL